MSQPIRSFLAAPSPEMPAVPQRPGVLVALAVVAAAVLFVGLLVLTDGLQGKAPGMPAGGHP
ncbi:MAG: hypothetical protein H6842_06635 [Rhodospirillaceae bacterium]|nr:hypothetical protein [Rhodospirillaceae bacterium]